MSDPVTDRAVDKLFNAAIREWANLHQVIPIGYALCALGTLQALAMLLVAEHWYTALGLAINATLFCFAGHHLWVWRKRLTRETVTFVADAQKEIDDERLRDD